MSVDTEFKYIIENAKAVKEAHAARDTALKGMTDMFLLKSSEEATITKKMHDVSFTMSPDVRNKILGALRLLIATYPSFSLDDDLNSKATMEISDKLEQAADKIFRAAGRAAGNPVHHDAILSTLLFAETHIGITRTVDLLDQAEKEGNRAAIHRVERINEITPFIYEVWDPRTGYPEIDNLGLRSYYREVETTAAAVKAEFGDDVEIGRAEGKINLSNYWNDEGRWVWITGQKEPLIEPEALGPPFIPIEVFTGEGSMLFENPEDQRQPFAYTLWKSGLWHRQNLALTVAYTLLRKIGMNPLFINKRNADNEKAVYNFDVAGGEVDVPQGGEWKMADLGSVINPRIMEMVGFADQKVGESTIYPQTLGEPLGGNAPFSMAALMHQAGRLPLLVPQRKTSWGLGGLMAKSLIWLREESVGAKYDTLLGDLKVSEIPKHMEMDAKLEVDLPQDKLQQATIAGRLRESSGGRPPLISDKWILENVMGISQPDKMAGEVFKEQSAELKAQQWVLEQMATLKQLKEQVMAPPQEIPPGAAGQAPGQPTPEQMQAMQEQAMMEQEQMQQQAGPPQQASTPGIPPVMSEGGGQPPVGTIPPEGEEATL